MKLKKTKTNMKAHLLIQLICSIILMALSAGMVIGAFINDSIVQWKAFTIFMFIFCIFFIKQSRKELKQ